MNLQDLIIKAWKSYREYVNQDTSKGVVTREAPTTECPKSRVRSYDKDLKIEEALLTKKERTLLRPYSKVVGMIKKPEDRSPLERLLQSILDSDILTQEISISKSKDGINTLVVKYKPKQPSEIL